MAPKRRVGIVGCGSLGQYLINAINSDAAAASALEIAFVWNRDFSKVLALGSAVPSSAHCRSLDDIAEFSADIIVEVCHPDVSAKWGVKFLQCADFYCGSPTAFADPAVETALRSAANGAFPPSTARADSSTSTAGAPGSGVENQSSTTADLDRTAAAAAVATSSSPDNASIIQDGAKHGLYVPAGALWGGQDIAKLADRGSLAYCEITMKKHPLSLKLEGPLGIKVDAMLAAGTQGEVVIYEGPVRGLCPLAPNNVNTMACAAIAGHTLGFDGTRCRLVADAALDAHVITIDVRGKPPASGGSPFRVYTERYNPAAPGAITGTATYASFLSSLIAAGGRGRGVHLC